MKAAKNNLFYVHIIGEGKYCIRVDGFQIYYTADRAEADAVTAALNQAFHLTRIS